MIWSSSRVSLDIEIDRAVFLAVGIECTLGGIQLLLPFGLFLDKFEPLLRLFRAPFDILPQIDLDDFVEGIPGGDRVGAAQGHFQYLGLLPLFLGSQVTLQRADRIKPEDARQCELGSGSGLQAGHEKAQNLTFTEIALSRLTDLARQQVLFLGAPQHIMSL